MKILLTGGLGFIGSALVRELIDDGRYDVVNVDKVTYAANPASLLGADSSPRYHHIQADIADASAMAHCFSEERPDAVVHLAAESHVDRSIDTPTDFIQTNIVGTYRLLDCALAHWNGLSAEAAERFRFLHVSTDEVFGSLGESGRFDEHTAYDPSSPYSASKAASDHLARAWHRTYGLPVVITNCSNNYGPCQFPEKLIPLMILKAMAGEALPVYGTGHNVRDWLYVEDHARALLRALKAGRVGDTYIIGGDCERTNLQVVQSICSILDELSPASMSHDQLITFVSDRPGHDYRYAIDASKIRDELGWTPTETFDSGLRRTVEWYLRNEHWWKPILDGTYCLDRLGKDRSDVT